MNKKKEDHSGIKFSAAFVNDILAAKMYHDSVRLRIKGAWRDAGDKLMAVAEISLQTKMSTEAACYLTEAAETYIKVDKGEALSAYKKSIKIYCDSGRFDIGGKLEQRVAYLNLYAQHWEDAALHFKRAANFLAGDKLLDQSDHCMQKAAECFIKVQSYAEAADLYLLIARSCVNSNLRRFNARDHLLMAILCHLAIPEAQVRTNPPLHYDVYQPPFIP
ncbi:soluble NSF attachment protein [Ochromonadaceae sp. CCMP2298]|nr:soluble NSF attachment protein [Ochromonadaceae sp. CCMP2298]